MKVQRSRMDAYDLTYRQPYCLITVSVNTEDQRTNGPENAHLKPDPGVLSHHEMTLTLNTHTPLLNS